MTIFGMGARAAMLAGALAFAGAASAGDDKAHSSSTQGEASEGMKPGSASGLGTTGQQDRSSTTAGTSGQSTSTETSGTSSTSSGMSSSSAQASNELSGRVEKFDHDSKTFTVAGQDLKVDSSTKVTKDGEKAELTDINEGDEIRASYSGSGDSMTAERIEVTSSGASTSGTSTGTTDAPAGRGGPMGPGTGAGQGDSAGTTSGTGSTGTPSSAGSDQSSGAAQPGGNK